jgi:hypothetical protein
MSQTQQKTFTVTLRPEHGVDAVHALRHLLKRASRDYGLRTVSIQETRLSRRNRVSRSDTSAVGVTIMSLGKRKGQEFLPRLKYDARSGTFFLEDRVNNKGRWETEQRNVTEGFRAIFDLEQAQRGWIHFPKGEAPDLVLVSAGEDPGKAPSEDHKEGFRLLVKVANGAAFGELREFMSTAVTTWNAVDALHTAWANQAAQHPGEVPTVKCTDIVKMETTAGTSFVPVCEIDGWVKRPLDMPKKPRIATNGGPRKPVKPTPKRGDLDDEIPSEGARARAAEVIGFLAPANR